MATTKSNRTHGLSKTREYRIFKAMINRCENPRCPYFNYYGGRGIKVSPQWRRSFEKFFEELGPCPPKFTIDRIDNNKGYEPGNCRWASRAEQSKNQRRCYWITFRGQTRHAADWAKETGISRGTIVWRFLRGWPLDKVLGMPSRQRLLTFNGKTQTAAEWARELGLKPALIAGRIRNGWTDDAEILTAPTGRRKAAVNA